MFVWIEHSPREKPKSDLKLGDIQTLRILTFDIYIYIVNDI